MTGRLAIAALVVCGLLAPGRSGMAATRQRPSGETSRVEAPLRAVPAPRPALAGSPSRDVGASYAQRESAAKNLEHFEGGGSAIYIGGSTLVVVLLIVLIIVIL